MSGLFNNYKASSMGGGVHGTVNLEDTDTIRVGLINGTTDYTVNLTTHQDWDDVGTYTLNACYGGNATQILAAGNRTTTDGVFDYNLDVTFDNVADDAGKVVDSLLHYKATGVIGSDPLICHHNGFSTILPNGGDIIISYDAQGIFTL